MNATSLERRLQRGDKEAAPIAAFQHPLPQSLQPSAEEIIWPGPRRIHFVHLTGMLAAALLVKGSGCLVVGQIVATA